MNRRAFQILTWLAWLALPLTALRYWQVWDRLPVYMATHFDAAGQPNGWMTREVSLKFALGLTAFLLVVFTAILFLIEKRKALDTFSWMLLGFFYLVTGFAYSANMAVLRHNLTGRPVELGWVSPLPLGVLALVVIYLAAHRGKPLPDEQWIATETHASPFFAVVFLLPLLVELWAFTVVPAGTVRISIALMCLLFAAIAAFAWSGFQYNFGPAGVEIRTLGFRLRSIPQSQIASYTVEPWNILRGYGIRGIGGTRAYVWGNKVVHIRTTGGDVFLGHSEPERIMRDLDLIKSTHREHEVSRG